MKEMQSAAVIQSNLYVKYEGEVLKGYGTSAFVDGNSNLGDVENIFGNYLTLFIKMKDGRLLVSGDYTIYDPGNHDFISFHIVNHEISTGGVKSVELGDRSYCFLMEDGSFKLQGKILSNFSKEYMFNWKVDSAGLYSPNVGTEEFKESFLVEKAAISDKNLSLLLKDGRLMVSGENKEGILGTGNSEKIDAITENICIKDAKNCFLFHNKSFFTLEDGSVIAFGENKYGMLGVGDTENSLLKRTVIGVNNPVQIMSVMGMVSFILEDGSVRVCGNMAAQLMRPNETCEKFIPLEVEKLKGTSFMFNDYGLSVYVKDNEFYFAGYNGEYGFFLRGEENYEGYYELTKEL